MASPSPIPHSVTAFSDELAAIVERVGASVVALHARRSYPSAALLWQPGVLVTTAHAIRRESGITAALPDGTTAPATLVGIDPGTDVAVLRLEAQRGAPASFSDAAKVRPGHFVVAVSRGMDGAVVASSGIVARAGGQWRTWRGGLMDRLVQLDGRLWPGFSGAPIADANGEVIGIGTSALTRGRAVVIPASVLRRAGEQLLAHGRVAEAFIGAAMRPIELPQSLRERLALGSTHGLIVLSLVSGGPAETAGITLGDILVTLDGAPLTDIDDLRNALLDKPIGSTVQVQRVRAGELATLQLVVGERPHARC